MGKSRLEEIQNKVQELSLKYVGDDIMGISLEDVTLLVEEIKIQKAIADGLRVQVKRQKDLASSIYAQAMLECDKNKYEERV